MAIVSSRGPKLWLSMCRSPSTFEEQSMLFEVHVKEGHDDSYVAAEAMAEGSEVASSSAVDSGDTILGDLIWGPPTPTNDVTYAALGCTIFALGGKPQSTHYGILNSRVGSHDVYGYSMASPKLGWFQLPSMLVGRVRPLTAVFNGKLYVFGGHSMSNPEPWAEVFDPHPREWLPLPELGYSQVLSAVAAVVCDTYKIILLVNPSRRTLHMFSPQLNTWKFYDLVPRHVNFCCDQPVMVGDAIYYCIYYRLHAYNIYSQDCLSTDIRGFPINFNHDNFIQYPSLIHIGGLTFYLVWSHEGRVHFTRIRACGTGTSFTAHVESDQFYYFDDVEVMFAGAFLMCGGTSEIILTGDKPETKVCLSSYNEVEDEFKDNSNV